MTVNQLKAFFAVCHEKSFTGAAAKLYTSRQALRQNIMALESELNQTLFDISANKPILTPAGKILYMEALEVVEAFDNLEHNLFEKRQYGKTYRLAVSKSLVPTYLPGLSDKIQFYSKREHMHFDITELQNDDVIKAIKEGECDCGLIMETDRENSLSRCELTNHCLALEISGDSQLWPFDEIAADKLKGEKICIPGVGKEFESLISAVNAEFIVTYSYYQVYYNIRENGYIAVNRYIPEEIDMPGYTKLVRIKDMPPICSAFYAKPNCERAISELGKILKEEYGK